MLTTGLGTLLFGASVWIWLPDSLLKARFLTIEEGVQAIFRIKSTHSGIEQKRFKRNQFIEAIRDPKTWMLFSFSLGIISLRHVLSIPNGI
jgi:hypothetical protein